MENKKYAKNITTTSTTATATITPTTRLLLNNRPHTTIKDYNIESKTIT